MSRLRCDCMENPLTGHDCGGQSYCFFVGTNAAPTPPRKVSDLDQKRCENFSNFHISKFFLTSVSEGNNFFLVLARFTSPNFSFGSFHFA